jgi:hypothetical protein
MEDIPVINWFEEPIKQSIKSVFDGVNLGVESLDIFKKYRSLHFELLHPLVAQVKILGMQNPVDLRDLYYPAVVSTDIRRRIYSPEWGTLDQGNEVVAPRLGQKSKPGKHKTSIAGDVYISNNKRVVVLGGPGAGKTTFLRYLALAYSDLELFQKTKLNTSYLPIYIHLPFVAREQLTIFEAICEPLRKRRVGHEKGFYSRLLELGTCTVFLDSLDEVPSDQRRNIVNQINDFVAQFPEARIVISCRTADYNQSFPDFVESELVRLSKEAVHSIVKAWFSKNTDKADRLLALLDHDQTVSSLTETPLLLSLLCIQFKNDLALPKKRTELYRRCVDALLRDWDTTRNFRRDTAYAMLSDDRKEKIFEAVAGASSDGSIEYEFTEPFLLTAISDEIARFSVDPSEAEGILEEIECHHGIVEKCSAETYQFSHSTMHEYFCARYVVAKRMEMEILRRHYEDDAWHNVIVFMASIMDDPSDILSYLVSKSSMEKFQNYPAFGRRLSHLLLLYRCMSMGVSVSPKLRSSICDHLVSSQVLMLNQLHKDGVIPFAARLQNGARQLLFTYKKTRGSISEILKPYRSLMNEMVLCPIEEYAESVRKYIDVTPFEGVGNRYQAIGLATCLLVPISSSNPQYFFARMMQYSAYLLRFKPNGEAIRAVIVESIATHKSMYPNLNEDNALPA